MLSMDINKNTTYGTTDLLNFELLGRQRDSHDTACIKKYFLFLYVTLINAHVFIFPPIATFEYFHSWFQILNPIWPANPLRRALSGPLFGCGLVLGTSCVGNSSLLSSRSPKINIQQSRNCSLGELWVCYCTYIKYTLVHISIYNI